MAMAKYSSITGQLAEMKKKILGSEKIVNDHSADIEGSQSTSQKESVMNTSEENNFMDSTSGTNSEEKSSLFLKSSQESFGQFSDYNYPTTPAEGKIEVSNLTLGTTIKESEEAEENIFKDIFKHFETKANASSCKRSNLSSSCDDSENEDEDGSIHSSSEDDRTIENLFLEEISKIDKNELNSDANKNENSGKDENQVWEESSDNSSINDIHIPYENIFPNEPMNIGKILEDEGILEGSKKIILSPKNSRDYMPDIYDNDDKFSVKTKMSQKNSLSKKKKLERKNASRKKSHESNVNSVITEVKSIKKTKSSKSIKREVIKIPLLKNQLKLRKEKSLFTEKNSNFKNGINKNLGNKINENNSFKVQPSKKASDIINPFQQSQVNAINSKSTKYNSKTSTIKKSGLVETNIHSKQVSKQQAKEISRTKKTNSSMPLFGKECDDKKNSVLKDKQLSKEIIKNSNKPISSSLSKKRNQFLSSKSDTKDDLESNPQNFETGRNCEIENGIEIVVPNPRDILSKIEEEIRAAKLKESKKVSSQLKILDKSNELNKLGSKNDSTKVVIKEKNIEKESSESNKLIKTKQILPEKKKLTKTISLKKKQESVLSFPQEIEAPSECNLQKDGERHSGLLVKKSFIKSIVSKNELIDSETIPLTCKKIFSNESMSEIQNEMLTMNIDEKKSLHFPFILGRSVSKSYNIQANIQQITSLVRMLPKESIQRTLLEETDVASRISTKTLGEKSEKGGCPACNEKALLSVGSDFISTDDPWDYTHKNFVRCTCLSKNTISSKHVLRQLLLQSTHGSTIPPSIETSSSILEETEDRKSPSQEQNSANPLKRNDLTKLLHATQRFVTNL